MNKAKKPTERDAAVLRAVADYLQTERFSPAVSDLMKATGYAFGTVHGSLGRLERFGLIERAQGISRSIRLLPGAKPQLRKKGR